MPGRRLRLNLLDMNGARVGNRGLVRIAGTLGGALVSVLADAVLSLLAPRYLASVHGLRRAAMAGYLSGCVLLALGATQVTTDGPGLAVLLLPAAVSVLTVAVGCHAKLRGKGADLVGPRT